ncbi:MAG: helix-turn-helix domain-containing protein [Christensenellales bacterium]|jgi:transcriptional regulator with XRE-family HTH domain
MNERIKQLRKTLGFTQQEFAERIGVKRNTIAQYETGRNEPIGSVLNLICKEYNVNPDWLRNGSGEMFIKPATFSLDEYAQTNKLNKTEISIIRGFMELNPDTRQAIYNVFSNAFNDEEDDILKYDEIPTAAEIEANYSPIAAEDLKGKNIG